VRGKAQTRGNDDSGSGSSEAAGDDFTDAEAAAPVMRTV